MKHYTDLEQSKRLAEILPLESADMEYLLEQWFDEKTQRYKEGFCEIPVVKVEDDCPLQPITIPCWSLSALLDVIQQVKLDTATNYNKKYWRCCAYYESDWHYSDWYDNPIDACYEQIIKLNELKLL